MRELCDTIIGHLERGDDLVLATIVERSGSTPRRRAQMLCGAGGRIAGTTGGGISEYLAEEEAKSLLAAKRSALKVYVLKPLESAGLGAVCGGSLTVYLQFLSSRRADLLPFFQTLKTSLAAGERLRLLTLLEEGPGPGALGLAAEGRAEPLAWAGCPRPEGAGPLPAPPPPQDADAKAAGAGSVDWGGRRWYVEEISGGERVFVFGSGHVARELVPLLARLDFRCILFDDRPEFADKAAFPQAQSIVLGSYNALGESLQAASGDYIVVLTRSHLLDLEGAAWALSGPARYIGVIGSRAKLAFIREECRKRGHPPAALACSRFHAPIGLAIGGETPAEIALAIAAELVAVRRGRR